MSHFLVGGRWPLLALALAVAAPAQALDDIVLGVGAGDDDTLIGRVSTRTGASARASSSAT